MLRMLSDQMSCRQHGEQTCELAGALPPADHVPAAAATFCASSRVSPAALMVTTQSLRRIRMTSPVPRGLAKNDACRPTRGKTIGPRRAWFALLIFIDS